MINYLDKFGPELLVIQFGFLVILSTLFLWLWFSNRRKYHNLKHAIPANIVKSYLDSIIQNSTALKSSLFRGGGMDLEGAIPSVMPLATLGGGESLGVSGAPSTALMEELNQKRALIASLEAQLSSSQTSQRELETKLVTSQGTISTQDKKIKELEALLAGSHTQGGGDAALKSELTMVTKERDEIRDRLREFEIISDDLANLKRLQQENEQLKRSLSAAQSGVVAAPEAAPAPKQTLSQSDVADLFDNLNSTPAPAEAAPVAGVPEDIAAASAADNQALENFLEASEQPVAAPSAASEEDVLASMEPEANTTKPKSDKTPEDLLSEFEKMLG